MKINQRGGERLDVKTLTDEGTFEGYASVFGNRDSYGDIIAPGAFAASLAEWKAKNAAPKLLYQHDPSRIIGVLEDIQEDDKGLYVKGRLLTNVQDGREALELLRAGAIDSMSIGYVTKNSSYDPERSIRTLTQIDLWEVSLVTFPANEAARVQGVKQADKIKSLQDFEGFLEDAGFTPEEAKRIASHGFGQKSPDQDPELLAAITRLTTSIRTA
jgi:HK97 family phage prohead protease